MGKRNSHATNGRQAPELGEIRARRRNRTTVPPYHLALKVISHSVSRCAVSLAIVRQIGCTG